MENKFPCTGCGSCCRRVDKVIETINSIENDYVREMFKFPYNQVDGVCEKLENNKCSIYENRPLICDSHICRRFLDVTQEEFNKSMIPLCNKMMDEDNIDISYRIPLPE